MKVCPKCGTAAADDNQAFCLMDGMPLVDQASSEPTVIMDRSQATVTSQHPQKKRNAGLWIILALVGIVVIGGLVGLLMYAAYRMGSQSAAVKVNVNGNSSPVPKASGTPKTTPPSPSPVSSPGSATSETSTSDEPTPITWTTSGSTFKTDVGLKYTFECPADGSAGTVWGSDTYTADSSICTAAVHAGKISLEKGGVVNIEFTGGRQTYGATTRNGITTYNYGQFPRSFVFRDR